MIEIEHLTKTYDAEPVVNNVSFTVAPHSITAIVGTSGSGKTTLLRMINRLVEPTSGVIKIDGCDNHELPIYELRRKIGYVIQQHGLFPHKTVAQNIATVPLLLGWGRQQINERVEELMELFQLDVSSLANRYPHELSGGQQQRVGVARALAAKPNVLLMDEPFGALDPVIRAKAQDDLLTTQRRFGITVILVTHDLEEAIHMGDKIAVMDKGRLLQYAAPAEIIANPATSFVEQLISTGDKPFRLLSLHSLSSVLEDGQATGKGLPETASQRDALAEMLWSGRQSLPVYSINGQPLGRVTLNTLIRQAERPV